MFGLSEFFHWILRMIFIVGVAVNPSLLAYGESEGKHDIFWVQMWQAFAVASLTVFIGFFLLRTAMRLQVRA
jgi:predicted exporter